MSISVPKSVYTIVSGYVLVLMCVQAGHDESQSFDGHLLYQGQR
jgi:hypothetical protein